MEWTDEKVLFLKNNYHKETCKAISDMLGCSTVAIQVRASLLGLKNVSIWTPEEDAILKEMYSDRSNKEIAQLLNRSPGAIKVRALKKFGLLRDRESVSRVCSEVRGQARDNKFFENIDTQEKAYLLGYIIGDGNINGYKITITCQIDDIETFYFFEYYLGKGSFHFPKGKNYGYLAINSYQLVTDLKKYGVVPNKTKTISMPTIREDLMRHLIRGLFDSDGCMYITPDPRQSRALITGNQHICSFIKDYIITHLGVRGTLYRNSQNDTVWNWALGGRKQLRKLYPFLYQDVTIFLARKHNKFVELGVHRG